MSQNVLNLDVVVSAPFAENTYIAHLEGRGDCIVVDPGLEPERIVAALRNRGLTPAAILNTHGHADHIGGNAVMKQLFPDAPLVIGKEDAVKLTDAALNLSAGYGFDVVSPPADELVVEDQVYSAAGLDLEVLETPGHSIGHVVFVWKAHSPWIVLGGDVLFQGSIGRTDFPDGSFDQLRDSIHGKLFTMPDDTVILPGHGDRTTVGDEKRHNPFVGLPAG